MTKGISGISMRQDFNAYIMEYVEHTHQFSFSARIVG